MKAYYQKMNDQILPSEDLKERVLTNLEQPKHKSFFRPLAAVPALMLVLLLALPVMAAVCGPSIQELMFLVAPKIAERFSPIQASDIANGIRMEVVSAAFHDTGLELYFSFQDLEGNRLNENTYLGEHSISRKPSLIPGNGGSSGSILEHLRLDAESNTYYAMLQSKYQFLNSSGSRNLTIQELFGEYITFNLESLQRDVELEDVVVPITMTEPIFRTVERTENGSFQFDSILDLIPAELTDIGLGGNNVSGWFDQESYTFMAPGEIITQITEDIAITNMYHLDGELHVQVRTQRKQEPESDLYRDFYFEDSKGNLIHNDRSFSLNYRQDGYNIDYTELIFKISQENLEHFRLICHISEHEIIKGPWKVTFPLSETNYQAEKDESVLPTVEYSASEGAAQGAIHIG